MHRMQVSTQGPLEQAVEGSACICQKVAKCFAQIKVFGTTKQAPCLPNFIITRRHPEDADI